MNSFDNDFIAGFEQGYRLIKGNNATMPSIPSQPSTPSNSTAFREGIKKGVYKASGIDLIKNDYKAGFEQGYKMIKGDNVVIPVLPIQPIVPIGSNPFRVGLKVGIDKAGAKITT